MDNRLSAKEILGKYKRKLPKAQNKPRHGRIRKP